MDDAQLKDELGAARAALRETQHALEAERRRAQRYLDVAGTLIVALDPEHRIAAVNRKGLEVLGHDEDALVGRRFTDALVCHLERATVGDRLAALGEETGPASVECAIVTRAGERRTIA